MLATVKKISTWILGAVILVGVFNFILYTFNNDIGNFFVFAWDSFWAAAARVTDFLLRIIHFRPMG